jgi:hypothetical protein
MDKAKPFAFIIMPFTKAVPLKSGYRELGKEELDTIYSLIRQILENLGYEVSRAESPTDILRDIVFELDRADLVVADLTSLNPNVMYELGIRHGFCKKTVLLTQDRTELPFDIAGYQCIEYRWVTDNQRVQLDRDLHRVLQLIDQHPDPRFGPVHTHLDSKHLGVLEKENEVIIQRLRALLTEIGFTAAELSGVVDNLHATFSNEVQNNKEGFAELPDQASAELEQHISNIKLDYFSLPATDLLLSMAYIPGEYDSYGEITEFMMRIRVWRNRLMEFVRTPTFGVLRWLMGHSTSFMEDITKIIIAIQGKRKGQPIWDTIIDDNFDLSLFMGLDQASEILKKKLHDRS